MIKLRIRRGDVVRVISGGARGQTGSVMAVNPKDGLVTVSGVNKARKRVKTVEGVVLKLVERPMAISNVAIVDPVLGGTTKVGFRFAEDGTKVRYAKASGSDIEYSVPDIKR